MPVFDLVQRGSRTKGELFTFETHATKEKNLTEAYHQVEVHVPTNVPTIKPEAFIAVTCRGTDENDEDVVAVTVRHLIEKSSKDPQQIALMVAPVSPRTGNHKLKFQVLVLQV